MPDLLSADHGESSRSRSRQRARAEVGEHRSMWDRLNFHKIGSWLKKDEQDLPPSPTNPARPAKTEESNKEIGRPHSSGGEHALSVSGLLNRRGSRKVIPGLPRPLTFKRMNSEKRDKLLEVPDEVEHRRTASVDRKPSPVAKRDPSPPPMSAPSMSAPDIMTPHESDVRQKPSTVFEEPTIGGGPDSNIPAGARQVDYGIEEAEDYASAAPEVPADVDPGPPPVEIVDALSEHGSQHPASDVDDIQLQEELEAKWILNLSMHFRDMSDREKFFVTFAEEPNRWRRVTVSCDYRNLEPDSLEHDLKTLHYQRDKSSRIYEAIRDSLAAIQFYDTVTNLKLETSDGRLHVHVTEDVNEIIPYPSSSAIEHLDCKRFKENAVSFDSHISGFVYKVSVNNRTFIKKEIPGPDAVEEFLYEINALVSLQESKSVINFEGVIVDEQNDVIKGLLISYAEQGALIDMIYDFKLTGQLYWERRERWARQIVQGLSEIHEAGFVQGDFTLSNIVVDNDDNAKIIDINRRGCPVGWEPPELAKLIRSGQRISIYIGVKSDLYQLGMVLWALAEQQDEPERQDRPLIEILDRPDTDVPVYFRNIIKACLSDLPRARPSATELLKQFPASSQEQSFKPRKATRDSVSTHRSDKEYIDPRTAVDLEDISQHQRHSRQQTSFESITKPSTDYPPSSGSYVLPDARSVRGRSPRPSSASDRNLRSDYSPYPGHRSVMSLDDSELENELASLPASRETRWEQVYIDGDTKLVQRGCGDIDVREYAAQEPKEICITSPPDDRANSLLGSKTSDTPSLSLSANGGGLQPIEPQSSQECLQKSPEMGHHRGVGNKKSFSDRVHELAHSCPQSSSPEPVETPDYYDSQHTHIPDSTVLANLEYDVAMDSSVTSTAPPSRVSTGFSVFDNPEPSRRVGTGLSVAQDYRMPMHQDSGFAEPERVSYESERIRHSLDESIKDLQFSKDDEARIDERLWDDKEYLGFDEGVRGRELEVKHVPIPIFTIPASPQKKEKPASTLMPPPGLPRVGPTNVLHVDEVKDKGLEEKNSNTTIRPPSITIPDFHQSIPKAINSSSPDIFFTPSAIGSPRAYTPSQKELRDPDYDDYLSPVDDDDDDDEPASSDLTAYLSHSISFEHAHSLDFYLRDNKQKVNGSREPKV